FLPHIHVLLVPGYTFCPYTWNLNDLKGVFLWAGGGKRDGRFEDAGSDNKGYPIKVFSIGVLPPHLLALSNCRPAFRSIYPKMERPDSARYNLLKQEYELKITKNSVTRYTS